MIRWGEAARILIADDSEEATAVLERVLKTDGYQCRTVRNGREALNACTPKTVDLVLLDLHMPELDGLTVCRRLKNTPETCLIPVLVMTGGADRAAYLQALEAGADDFLQKPVALAELRARVRSAIKMKACVDELDNAAAAVVMLGATIEARDRRTNGHCERLAEYSCALGRRIGLDHHDVHALRQGGYVHDLGKIAIPDAVLLKAGPLTADEYELVKSHPAVGDRICAPLRTLERARAIIRSHHEKLDGTGYPDGLRGAAVPLLAQVTAIADVYDALTSDRPYRQALAPGMAIDMLWHEATIGKRDRTLVEEFSAIVEDPASSLAARPLATQAGRQPAHGRASEAPGLLTLSRAAAL